MAVKAEGGCGVYSGGSDGGCGCHGSSNGDVSGEGGGVTEA